MGNFQRHFNSWYLEHFQCNCSLGECHRISLIKSDHFKVQKEIHIYFHSWKCTCWWLSNTGVTSSLGIVMTKLMSQTRWHHQMETFSTLLALCAGNSPVTGEFTGQRSVTQNFDVFFDKRLEINGWVNNHEAGDLKHHRTHYDINVMVN